MIEDQGRQRLSRAVQQEMNHARAAHTAVSVREVASRVISETESDPELLDDVVDALCALCIRSGLIIEFSPPPHSHAA